MNSDLERNPVIRSETVALTYAHTYVHTCTQAGRLLFSGHALRGIGSNTSDGSKEEKERKAPERSLGRSKKSTGAAEDLSRAQQEEEGLAKSASAPDHDDGSSGSGGGVGGLSGRQVKIRGEKSCCTDCKDFSISFSSSLSSEERSPLTFCFCNIQNELCPFLFLLTV